MATVTEEQDLCFYFILINVSWTGDGSVWPVAAVLASAELEGGSALFTLCHVTLLASRKPMVPNLVGEGDGAADSGPGLAGSESPRMGWECPILMSFPRSFEASCQWTPL